MFAVCGIRHCTYLVCLYMYIKVLANMILISEKKLSVLCTLVLDTWSFPNINGFLRFHFLLLEI